MRYLSFVTFLLFNLCISAQEIPKNADVILVKGIAFDKAVESLLDSGYVMEKMDKDFHTLTTEYKKLCKECIPEISFYVRVKDSVATITGKWRSTLNLFSGPTSKNAEDNAMVFDVKNEKGKVPRAAFRAMQTFALSLNGEVTYRVSK